MEGIDDPDGLGFDLPSLSQSPQMFPGFNAGPASQSFSGSGFQDESTIGNGDENSDPKRRRIARVSYSMVPATAKQSILRPLPLPN